MKRINKKKTKLSRQKVYVVKDGDVAEMTVLATKPKVVKKSNFVYDLHDGISFISQGNETLDSLRKHALAYRTSLNEAIVYKRNIKTGEAIKLGISKYAFKNKLYGPSKSIDGTGFYYEWSWEKKTPFEQPPTKPLPKSFTEPTPPIIVESSMPVKKTFWQKVKQYILNMFE